MVGIASWFWPAAFWTLVGLGALMTAWALRGERSRGRRRCPKCWYDMAGVPGLTCPECGKAARSEKKLHRARVRLRRLGPAALALLAAYGAVAWPRVERSGWIGAVPTTVLVVGAKWIGERAKPGITFRVSGGRPLVPVSTYAPWDRAYIEVLDERLKRGMWNWQWRVMIEACLSGDTDAMLRRFGGLSGGEGGFLQAAQRAGRLSERDQRRLKECGFVTVRARRKWPVGVPICAEWFGSSWPREPNTLFIMTPITPGAPLIRAFEQHYFSGLCSYTTERQEIFDDLKRNISRWSDSRDELPPVAGSTQALEYELAFGDEPKDMKDWRPDRVRRVTLPIEIVPSIADVLRPVQRRGLTSGIAAGLSPRLDLRAGGRRPPRLCVKPWWVREALMVHGNPTLAARFEVRRDGVPVYEGRAWWWFGGISPAGGTPQDWESSVELTPISRSSPTPKEDGGQWTVLVSADPALALRNFECDCYWEGEFEAPLTHSPQSARPGAEARPR